MATSISIDKENERQRLSDESDYFDTVEDTEEPPSLSSSVRRWKWTAYLLAILSIVQFLFLMWPKYIPTRNTYETGFSTDFDDVKPHIRLEERRFGSAIRATENGTLYRVDNPGEKRYTGNYPPEEINASWKELLGERYFLFDQYEIEELNQDTFQPDLEPLVKTRKNITVPQSGIYGGVDMLHSLHCLDILRRRIRPHGSLGHHHSFPVEIEEMHVDHCIDQLRQTIMCSGDLTPVTLKPVIQIREDRRYLILLGETERTHTCRDFDAVKQWHPTIMADVELRRPHDGGIQSLPSESNSVDHNNAEAFEDVPPNGGYGWVCTFCCFMTNVHTWGVNSSWGVILAHFLSDSTYPNAGHLEYAFIGGLSIAMCMLIGPVVTKTYNAIGSKLTMLMGTGLVFGSLLSASYATQIWHLFLSQGICFGIGMGFLYITALSVLPEWFSTRRSFSMGLAASGSGLGGVAYNLAAGRAIQTLGVADTYRVLAFCALGGNLVASMLMKDRPASRRGTRPRTFNHRDLSQFEVLLVILWGVTTEFGYVTLVYSLPNYASSIHLTPQQGSVVGAILNLGLAIGRPVVGYVSDTLGRITISMFMTAFCGLFCFAIWIPAQSYAPLLVFALLAGMVCGTFWGTITPVTAEVVGMNRLPSTFAMICLTLVVPTTVAEPVALSIVASSGYLSAQVYVALMFILGALSLWVLRSWKFYEIEMKAAREREGVLASFPSFFSWIAPRKLFLNGRV
ncbi:hypothetical protein FE257_002662 [Aspergillus nanangensis]|uniref:Major facilitator superfamily (MFS) profile domain-containing protein n=1 Tax=Aspergillus nanangensis TaxID=2582783 RepID=A0AAD4GN90_ASPNN|nr:hypothetical protein FE257_002662 [Aspergillus nanangensis]